MIALSIIGIVAVIVYVLCVINAWSVGPGFAIFISLLFGALGGLAAMFILTIISVIGPGQSYPVSETKIVNVQDGTNIHGAFFLFAGSVGEDDVFKYYTVSHGNYRLRTSYAENTTIRQDNSRPRIVKYCVDSKWQWLRLPGDHCDLDERYVIHVPPGSIKQQFVLGE